MKPKNYLNNKDLLKEIHRSKITYCSFVDPKYADFDCIVSDVNDIAANIETARLSRAKSTIRADNPDAPTNTKINDDELAARLAEINVADLVFRVMTWDHIPVREIEKKEKAAESALSAFSTLFAEEEGGVGNEDDVLTEYDVVIPELAIPGDLVTPAPPKKARVNFPPFLHYVLDSNMQPVLVGKSHWQGSLEDGVFCIHHGAMTRKFADMIMKLCKRYASRSNWRGYTYNDEMVSQALLQLSYVGLQFNEAKSDNPFAYLTAIAHNSFSRVLNVEKKNQNIRDDILEQNNMNPSYSRQNSGATRPTYEE